MIRALLDKHLSKAMSTQLSDATHSFTGVRQGGAGRYDPVTDSYIGGATLEYQGRGILSQYSSIEQQSPNIDALDIKLTCLQSEIAALGVITKPSIDDMINVMGQDKRVISVTQDSASATWVLQLRGLNVGY